MRVIKETFWDNERWRVTVPAGIAGLVCPAVGYALGLTPEDFGFWIVVIPGSALVGLLAALAFRFLKPIDRARSAPLSTSRKAMKWMIAMDWTFAGMLLLGFLLDRTFWLALAGTAMFTVIGVWNLRRLLEHNRRNERS